ncbi:MAG: hypothetical protein VW688_03455 [Gammaproteobacteria bacterium]|jgi:hypothetical protein
MIWLVVFGVIAACQSVPTQEGFNKYFGTVLVKNNQSQLKSNVVVYEDPTGIIIQLIKPIVGKIGDIKISSEGSKVTFVNTDMDFLKDFERSLSEDKGLIRETLSKCLSKGSMQRSFQETFVICSKNSGNDLEIKFKTYHGFSGEFNLKQEG